MRGFFRPIFRGFGEIRSVTFNFFMGKKRYILAIFTLQGKLDPYFSIFRVFKGSGGVGPGFWGAGGLARGFRGLAYEVASEG